MKTILIVLLPLAGCAYAPPTIAPIHARPSHHHHHHGDAPHRPPACRRLADDIVVCTVDGPHGRR